MQLTPQLVASYKEAITNPSKHGLPNRPMAECFAQSDAVTASHILAKDFIENEYRNLPKAILYIIMIDIYGQPSGKDTDGSAGYHLKYIPAS